MKTFLFSVYGGGDSGHYFYLVTAYSEGRAKEIYEEKHGKFHFLDGCEEISTNKEGITTVVEYDNPDYEG